MKQKDEELSQLATIIAEINERGGSLTAAFVELRKDELIEMLPDLKALNDSQKGVLDALKEIQQKEVKIAED